jgi:stearoyl-CoA desaturase (delta-9 desaturase)
VSVSPVVVVYAALAAIPWIDIDPWSFAVTVAVALVAGWGIVGGFHRYFAHRSYKTSRPVQLLIAAIGCLALQKGPLWWAAVHRGHHRTADTPDDPHSPIVGGFWHGHVGWLFGRDLLATNPDLVKDLSKYPELVWLDRLWLAPGLLFAAACYLALGWGGVVIGYCLAVGIVFQVTFLVNSVGHLFGSRRFAVADHSRNNIVVGYLAMGEGWHNNHHRVPYSARCGFAWYELDTAYLVIRLLARAGLVWGVRLPPPELLAGTKPPASSGPVPTASPG